MLLAHITDIETEAHRATDWQNWDLSPGLFDFPPHKCTNQFRGKDVFLLLKPHMPRITHTAPPWETVPWEHIPNPVTPRNSECLFCDFEHFFWLSKMYNCLYGVLTTDPFYSKPKRKKICSCCSWTSSRDRATPRPKIPAPTLNPNHIWDK